MRCIVVDLVLLNDGVEEWRCLTVSLLLLNGSYCRRHGEVVQTASAEVACVDPAGRFHVMVRCWVGAAAAAAAELVSVWACPRVFV